jgi:hypothetical protein
MWLAPNLITLLGTMGLVVGYAASAIYLPEFEGGLCLHCMAPWLDVPVSLAGLDEEGLCSGQTSSSGCDCRRCAIVGVLPQRLCSADVSASGLPGWQAGAPHEELLTARPAL